MEQFERQINITFRWWNNDGEINPQHEEQLEEHAQERIMNMIVEGYGEGELLYEIDDINYSGYWKYKQIK